MNLQTVLAAVLTAALLSVVGCDRPKSPTAGSDGNISAWDPAIADTARLVDRLPGNTIAYLRMPSVWGLATAPKSGALGRGLDTPANREAVSALQARLPEILQAELGPLAPVVGLLLGSLRSPLEVALVGDGPQPLEADLIIEGRFDFGSAEELNTVLAELTGQSALLQLLEPAADERPGQILATLLPIFYDFDPETQRARFLSGMNASAESLAESHAWQAAGESSLKEFEQRIDDSRHGFFLWTDMGRLGPMMRQGLDQQQLARLEALGVFATRQLALGYGSSDGKARLALLAEGREGRLWDLTLPASGPLEIDSNGQPDFVAGLTLPGSDWVRRLADSMGEDAGRNLAEIDARLEREIGIGLDAVVDTLSGRMTIVDDANGTYLVHEGSAERWEEFWEALSRRFDIERSSVRIGDSRIHHLRIPGIDISDQIAALPEKNPGLAFIMSRSMRAGTHLFWMPEGDHILMAAVPQVLRARLDHPGNVAIGEWLAAAGVDTGRAGLFGALRVDDAPRRNYYAYISTLLGLADMLDTDIDINAFPTARELELPETGSVAFALDYSDGRLGATLAFDNHPGDLFYAGGGSLGSVAVLGILAAVAIPAYQDYTTRAAVAAAYAATAEFRVRIAGHVAEHGQLPQGPLASGWASSVPLQADILSVMWQPEPAGLRLILSGGRGLDENAKLVISPSIEDGRLVGWSCSDSTIERKHLPSSCR